MTHRSYCFTIFDVESFDDKWDDDVRYVCYQLEQTKESKMHWQGYIELNKPMRFNQLKERYLTEDAHIEPRMGTRVQARAYCMKTESRWPNTEPVEWGSFKAGGQGHRNDLDSIAEDIKKNGLEQAIDTFPAGFIKFHNGMQKLHNHYKRHDLRANVEFRRLGITERPPRGTYCTQDGSSIKECFAGYAGEQAIYIRPSDGITRHRARIFSDLPFWTGERWAEWTIVYGHQINF